MDIGHKVLVLVLVFNRRIGGQIFEPCANFFYDLLIFAIAGIHTRRLGGRIIDNLPTKIC